MFTKEKNKHLLLSYICIGKDQLREHLCSPPVFVLSVLLIILVFCVVSLCFVCLRTVSCVPVIRVSLDCPFLLVPSVFSNIYLTSILLLASIYIQYTYIVGKYKIYLYELQKQAEQRAFGELFMPVSQRVQMNFIFDDNVRILCLSCNVKKVGKLGQI